MNKRYNHNIIVRYIIMAYNSEFDKVHYPLPLNYEENVDNTKLKITIQRMKEELDVIKMGKVDDIASRDSYK